MHATASELADYLADHIVPVCGVISRVQAERMLFNRFRFLTGLQITQAILIADGRRQIVREHGGATLRKGK